MLTEAFTALASAGGATLAGAMATDAWDAAKAGFIRLIGRDDPQRIEAIGGQLERSRTQLERLLGSELQRARTTQAVVWRTRLEDLLEEQPQAADELQQLIEQVQAQLPAPQQVWVQRNTFHGTGYVVQDGNLNVHHYPPGV